MENKRLLFKCNPINTAALMSTLHAWLQFFSPLSLFLLFLPDFNSKPSICCCWVSRTLPYANAASWNGEQRDAADYCSFWLRSWRRWRCVGEAAFCALNEFNLSRASLLQQLCSRASLGEVARKSCTLPLVAWTFKPVEGRACCHQNLNFSMHIIKKNAQLCKTNV